MLIRSFFSLISYHPLPRWQALADLVSSWGTVDKSADYKTDKKRLLLARQGLIFNEDRDIDPMVCMCVLFLVNQCVVRR
jgi:hypothetical protein